MSETVVRLRLHQKQMQFVGAPEHYLGFVGGIGSGKTWAGCIRAMMAASGQIGNQTIQTPNLGVVTAPTYTMLRDATLRTFLDLGAGAIKDYHRSDNRVTLTNGSEVLFRSTEHPERLRGTTAAWWFGDEAALYDAGVWQIMIGRLRQFGQQGYAWIATSPKGRNWVWTKFVRDQGDSPDYRLIKARTRDNVHLAQDFIAGLYNEYSGDFAAQELDGEFVAFEGLIYPEFQREVHITRETIDMRQYKRLIAGVDWGFTNPGVMLIGGIDGDGSLTVLHEEYQRQRRIEEWVDVGRQLREMYPVEAWYCDPSKPEYIALLKQAGLAAEAADNRVELGIQAVRRRLVVRGDGAARLRLAAGVVNLAAEFEQYQWATGRDGLKDQPLKANDHCLDSLRYMVQGAEVVKRQAPSATVSGWA